MRIVGYPIGLPGVSLSDTLCPLRSLGGCCLAGERGIPTGRQGGQFRFVVNTRENAFEPPHVHVWVGN